MEIFKKNHRKGGGCGYKSVTQEILSIEIFCTLTMVVIMNLHVIKLHGMTHIHMMNTCKTDEL